MKGSKTPPAAALMAGEADAAAVSPLAAWLRHWWPESYSDGESTSRDKLSVVERERENRWLSKLSEPENRWLSKLSDAKSRGGGVVYPEEVSVPAAIASAVAAGADAALEAASASTAALAAGADVALEAASASTSALASFGAALYAGAVLASAYGAAMMGHEAGRSDAAAAADSSAATGQAEAEAEAEAAEAEAEAEAADVVAGTAVETALCTVAVERRRRLAFCMLCVRATGAEFADNDDIPRCLEAWDAALRLEEPLLVLYDFTRGHAPPLLLGRKLLQPALRWADANGE